MARRRRHGGGIAVRRGRRRGDSHRGSRPRARRGLTSGTVWRLATDVAAHAIDRAGAHPCGAPHSVRCGARSRRGGRGLVSRTVVVRGAMMRSFGLWREQDGAAVVEFALVMPILALLVFCI